jgi:hypothetical protein
MRIGHLEVFVRQQPDNSWKYDIVNTTTEQVEHSGYRPKEHEASAAAFEDAQFIRAFS